MAAYSYQALDDTGKKVKGVLEGDSERHVRSQLRSRKLKPIEVKSVRSRMQASNKSKASSFSFGGPRMNSREVSLFTRQLASLVQSGLPLDEVLAAAAKQTRKPSVKTIVLQVRSRVVEGLSLAQALAEMPKIFDNLYRAMIKAGESSGYLGPVLEQLAEYTEHSQETSQKLKSAMVYPIVMVCISVIIVAVMMTKVVPQLVGLFENNSRDLPFVTTLLIGMSDFLVNWGFLVVLACIGLVFFVRWLLQHKDRRKRWHATMLKLPIFGNFMLQADTARYASTLGLLAKSGVPLLEALKIATQVLDNLVLQDASKQIATLVQEGSSLSKALDQVDVFPPLLVQMVASGEANGKLSEQLEYAAKNQQRELEFSITALMSLMEPGMMLFMGGMVGFIVMAILLPIFQLNDFAAQ